mmetsp:Transcript_19489/g.32252  ORF Transcript_19489/g.32252 Transcript_19489/m.32252 type:complete len:162 (+) Transcript_19489:47-532(+)
MMNGQQARKTRLRRMISGVQTGVDQASLRTAFDAGRPRDRWLVPTQKDLRNWPHRPSRVFPIGLWETPKQKSHRSPSNIERSMRTEWNVRDRHATPVFHLGCSPTCTCDCTGEPISSCPGTRWTLDCARKLSFSKSEDHRSRYIKLRATKTQHDYNSLNNQ